ncbi:MAG: transglutaminase-like domain-containing protein [bacterium]|nr:transglutaminase-like domain-containing protein [bacterium]
MTDMTKRTTSIQLNAADLNERGQLSGLQFDARDQHILLCNRVLVEDDATAIGQPEGATERSWFELLGAGVRIRKELVVEDGRVHGAQLTWCGVEPENNEVPLHLSVNGVDLVRPATKFAHPQCRHYYTSDWAPSHFDNWFVVELPAGALRSGINTIDMWSEAPWQVMVAADSELSRGSDPPRSPVGRSARSLDNGVSWTPHGLGQKHEISGEYCIRVSLDQHQREGFYRSPAIDVTAEAAADIHRRLTVESCTAEWHVAGVGTVDVRVRFADTPVEDAPGWSDWLAVSGLRGQWPTPAGRWLQFEATLGTQDPTRSPALQGCTIGATLQLAPGDEPRARLAELQQGAVTRSSVAYTWEEPAALADLRERFELDRVIAGAPTEFAAQLRLMNWAYRIPIEPLNPYAWRYDDLPQLERDEEGEIRLLGPYDQPRRAGHCLHCNLTLIAALLSCGYPARWVNISTKHTYGHEVTEVWSNDFDKWVFLDATRDYYMVDPHSGVPLSLRQIADRVGDVVPQPVTWDRPIPGQLPGGVSPASVNVAYRRPNHGGPVFADGAEHDMLMIGHLQMPLRNDFATRPHPVPWRVSSNWGSSAFYCWSSPMFPPKLEYAHTTDRWQDWEPALNRVQLTLSETVETGVLRIDADTVTPWWDAFEVRLDDGAWQTQTDSRWSWVLHEGVNHLRVRARNRALIRGPESRAVVYLTA